MTRGGWLLLGGSVVSGLANYGYTLVLIFLLSPPEFSKVASISALLLLVGTAAATTVPWVIAREMRNAEESVARRQRAVSFTLTTALGAGTVATVLVGVLTVRYAGPALLAITAVSCVGIFVTSAGAGYLQGTERLTMLAIYRLTEVAGKVLSGLAGAVALRTAEGGILGFAFGALVCAGWALWLMRHDLRRSSRRVRQWRTLWRHALGTGAVQALCTLLQAMDVIVLGLCAGSTSAVAGYQGMLILARVPLFVGTALSTVCFPRLAADRTSRSEARRIVRDMLGIYLMLAGGIATLLIICPPSALALVLPEHYTTFDSLLTPLAVAGMFAGLLGLVTTFLQARGRYRVLTTALGVAVFGCALALPIVSADLLRLAWVMACVLGLTSAVVLVLLHREIRPPAQRAPAEDPGDRLRQVVRQATRDRALIVGNYGNGNTGDESILAGLIGLSDRPDHITVVSRDPDQISALHGVNAVRTLSATSLLAFLRTRTICIGGGGMFGRGLPPLVRLLPWVALAGRLLGKRVYFLSLGAYRSTPVTTKLPLQLAARAATAVTVRDPESRATLSSGLSGRRDVSVVSDPSIFVRPASAFQITELLRGVRIAGAEGAPLLVSVKAMPDPVALHRVITELARALAGWAEHHSNPIFVVAMSEVGDYGLGPAQSDSVLGETLIRRAGLAHRAAVLGPGLEPRLVKGLHAQALGVIAMRLHSQIFATSTGVPLLGISFEAKCRLWLADAEAHDMPAEHADAAVIAEWLTRLRARQPFSSMTR